MSEIKCVIFDVGGVIVRGSLFGFLRKAYGVLKMKYTYIPPEAEIIPREFFMGKMSARAAFNATFGRELTGSQELEIVNLWKETWKFDDHVGAMLHALKSQGIKLALLSNSDPVNFPMYQGKGYFDLFDVMVFSHEVGLLKPDKAIYELVLERVGFNAEECAYVDDQERCLVPAKEMGMDVVHYRKSSDLERLI